MGWSLECSLTHWPGANVHEAPIQTGAGLYPLTPASPSLTWVNPLWTGPGRRLMVLTAGAGVYVCVCACVYGQVKTYTSAGWRSIRIGCKSYTYWKKTRHKNAANVFFIYNYCQGYLLFVQVPPPSLLLSPSLTSRVKSAVSARSSVHSQGVLRAGSFLKTLLMDWPDIPSKWSTLSVNSLSDKDPLLFTFPFYKSSP